MPSRDRRRILHLIDTGGPGGAETVYFELARGLPDLGWESIPVVPEVDWLDNALRGVGFDPACFDTVGRFDVTYTLRLRRLIREQNISLVQTHLLGTSVYATLACSGMGVPIVSTLHGQPDIPASDRLRKLKTRLLTRSANRIVCVSDSLREYFQRAGLLPRGAEVIPNGIDTRVFSPEGGGRDRDDRVRAEIGIPPDAILIGAVGNVRESKDYPTLLRAFREVRRVLPNSRLMVVGQTGGPLFERLERLREDLALSEVCHFIGFREDVANLLRALDLFVLSSSDEGFSLATVQAMATGLPVVATRCGGPEQIVGDSGAAVLVPPRDPEALAAAILNLLAHPDLAQRLGAAGRQRALEAFSLERMVARYSDLYERCLVAS